MDDDPETEVRPDRRLVAIHEAGHAVAAHVLGRAVLRVTIVPEPGSRGSVDDFPPRGSSKAFGGLSVRIADKQIMVHMAGVEAAHRVSSDHIGVEQGGGYDYDRAFELASLLTYSGDPDEARARIAFLRVRVRSLLEVPVHWAAVEHVAEQLLERPTMNSRQAKACIQAGMDAYFADLEATLQAVSGER